MAAWTPMGMDGGDSNGPYEGVPVWLEKGVWDWLWLELNGGQLESSYVDRLLARWDRISRNEYPLANSYARNGKGVVRLTLEAEPDKYLAFIDFVLAQNERGGTSDLAAGLLEELLREGGSAWKVGTRLGKTGLERRVPAGVQSAADAVMASGSRAGERLATAWQEAFGVSPDPSKAYAEAVKALEDAAIPVVVPKQADATLGHVIGRLRSDGDWSLPLSREDSTAPSSETVLRMCQGLWKGHHDRHGGDSNAPAQVSQAEAEAALFLAVPLVQWFTSGAVARR